MIEEIGARAPALSSFFAGANVTAPVFTAPEDTHRMHIDYRMVYECANDSMIFHDGRTGEILEVNQRACELYGYSREELLKLQVGTDLSPNTARFNQGTAMDLIREALSSDGILTFDWMIRRSDGTVIPVEGNLKRIEGTSPPLLLGMARDISQRKNLEGRLREQGRYFKRLISMSSDGIALIDRSGILQYVSPSVRSILGIPSRVTIKENVFHYLAADDARRLSALLARARRGEVQEGIVDYRIRDVHGHWKNHEASFRNFLHDARFGYVLINFRDVTERLLEEEKEKDRQRQLNHFWRLTIAGEVAAAVAHEVNQPLFSALNFFAGCRRRIEAGATDLGEIDEALDLAGKELERAARIIASVRNFTRDKPLVIREMPLSSILDAIQDFIEIQAKHAHVTLSVDVAEDANVACDDQLIQQVLSNLVTNAIESMAEMPEEARQLRIVTSRTTASRITVSVIDSGGNFPFNSLDELPGRFYTTKESGVGLGLSLCRSIIDAHHGELGMEHLASPPGSRFYFSLPIA